MNNWERLEAVIRWTSMTTNAFARRIGLPRAENLYQIKRGNNGISRRLAERIAEVYPEISRAWLLTGRGTMFVGEDAPTAVVPYFEEDVRMALGLVDLLEPACDMVVPGFARCDFAMCYGGQPGEREGDQVTVLFLRRCAADGPVAAGEYVVLTGNCGSLCTIDGSDDGGERPHGLFCEVTGRMVITRPAAGHDPEPAEGLPG